MADKVDKPASDTNPDKPEGDKPNDGYDHAKYKTAIKNLSKKVEDQDKPSDKPADKPADDKPADDKPGDKGDKPEPSSSAFDSLNPDKPADDKPTDKPADNLDNINLPDDANQKSKDSFAKMRIQSREIITSRDEEIVELKKKVAAGGGNDTEAVKTLTEERDKLATRLGQLNVKETPEYKEKITQPREEARDAIEKIFKDNNMQGSVDVLLAKTGKELGDAIDAMSENISSMERNKLARHVENWEHIAHLEDQIIKNADTASTALYQNNVNRMEEIFVSRYTEVVGKHGMLMDELAMPEKADEKQQASINYYNESIKRMQEGAHRKATGDMSENEIADMATMAEIGRHLVDAGIPRLTYEYNTMANLLMKAHDIIVALEGGSPSPSGGDIDDSEPSETDYSKPFSETDYKVTLKNVVRNFRHKR